MGSANSPFTFGMHAAVQHHVRPARVRAWSSSHRSPPSSHRPSKASETYSTSFTGTFITVSMDTSIQLATLTSDRKAKTARRSAIYDLLYRLPSDTMMKLITEKLLWERPIQKSGPGGQVCNENVF